MGSLKAEAMTEKFLPTLGKGSSQAMQDFVVSCRPSHLYGEFDAQRHRDPLSRLQKTSLKRFARQVYKEDFH